MRQYVSAPGSIQFGRFDPLSPTGGHQHLAPDDDGADSSPGENRGLDRQSPGAVFRAAQVPLLGAPAFALTPGSRSRGGAASADQGQRGWDCWLYLISCPGVMTWVGQCAGSGVIQLYSAQI